MAGKKRTVADPEDSIRFQLSRAYCRLLEKKIGKRKMQELRDRGAAPDSEVRCASERYGVDSGMLMRKAWIEVTGYVPPLEHPEDKKVPERWDTSFHWTDSVRISEHMKGAFYINGLRNYWPESGGAD